MDPRGRIAVVTGAAGGIGSALVTGLVDAGARAVVAVDLEAPTATDSKGVLSRRLDVTDEAATRSLVAEIEDSVGPVDVWFANAGLAGGGGPETPDVTWDRPWQGEGT